MADAAIRREDIIGRCITGVRQTAWSGAAGNAGADHDAHYCKIVVEIDSGIQILFTNSAIDVPDADVPLIDAQVFGNPDLSYLGQSIRELVYDQFGELYIILANGVYVQNLVLESTGNCFWIGSIEELRGDQDEDDPLVLREYWGRDEVQLW